MRLAAGPTRSVAGSQTRTGYPIVRLSTYTRRLFAHPTGVRPSRTPVPDLSRSACNQANYVNNVLSRSVGTSVSHNDGLEVCSSASRNQRPAFACIFPARCRHGCVAADIPHGRSAIQEDLMCQQRRDSNSCVQSRNRTGSAHCECIKPLSSLIVHSQPV